MLGNKQNILSLIGFVVILVMIPVGMYIVQSTQIFRSRASSGQFKVLLFTKTNGFRHNEAIVAASTVLPQLGIQNGFSVDTTEDPTKFNDANLSQYKTVVFLTKSIDPETEPGANPVDVEFLSPDQRAAFERYIQNGGGFVGLHSTADSGYTWPWFGGLVGAYFKTHGTQQARGNILIADKVHPATTGISTPWALEEEWYSFKTNPRGNVHVLASLDKKNFNDPNKELMPEDHPIVWCQEYQGGRSFYIEPGHNGSTYSDANYQKLLVGAIKYTALGEGECGATVNSNFSLQELVKNIPYAVDMTVAPDGKVYLVELFGEVKRYDPQTRAISTLISISVFGEFENGLLGITLDPNFAQNNWIYLLYSPMPENANKNRVSRFTVSGNKIEPSSEKVIIDIPTERCTCNHEAGSLAFDKAGNLYISTGDETFPFYVDGYTPIDERSNPPGRDAQRTSGNTNDLRGKILRIKPNAQGGYDIPDGNLFPKNGAGGRPEIYVMGVRNPFKMTIDRQTGAVYWGDVGPDAEVENPNRGPRGYDEINVAKNAGNFGWPYCLADNKPYNAYNFTTQVSGSAFDCNNLVNNSINNTGSKNLPPAQGALIWYPYAKIDRPEDGFMALNPKFNQEKGIDYEGRTAIVGPVYNFDRSKYQQNNNVTLPGYFDKTLFIGDYIRNSIKEVKFDSQGNVLKINPFLPNQNILRPVDIEIGESGELYILEHGNAGRLLRVEYSKGLLSPVAVINSDKTAGPVGMTVNFSSNGSSITDGNQGNVTYTWDLNGDGETDATGSSTSYTYPTARTFIARLTVKNGFNRENSAVQTIHVGNNSPQVTISEPVNGGFYGSSDNILFKVVVNDLEDGNSQSNPSLCSRLQVIPFMGHNDHTHPQSLTRGCSGNFITLPGDGLPNENFWYELEASYTDSLQGNSGSVTSSTKYILNPKKIEAEHYSDRRPVSKSLMRNEQTTDVGGGYAVGYISNNDWIAFEPMNFKNINSITYRVASALSGGTIEAHLGSPEGQLISSVTVPSTGDWQRWIDVQSSLTDPGGTHKVYFVFKGGAGYLFNLNSLNFKGSGVFTNIRPEGSFDEVINSSCTIRGWAYDPNTPEQSIQVKVFKDVDINGVGEEVGQYPANKIRTDLQNKPYGFEIQLPGLNDDQDHTISVWGIDSSGENNNSQLLNSPKTIHCTSGNTLTPTPIATPTPEGSSNPSDIIKTLLQFFGQNKQNSPDSDKNNDGLINELDFGAVYSR